MQTDHGHTDEHLKVYGLMAEFNEPEDVVDAAKRAYDHGYRKMDAYSPFPVHGLAEAVGFKKTHVPGVVMIGGVMGALAGYLMQYISMGLHYPFLVGGRPLVSWPMFIPITFEMGILFGAFSAVFGMFAMNGLPMPYHAVFNVPGFANATRDKFFLCIEAEDDRYDADETRVFLESLGAHQVSVVPR